MSLGECISNLTAAQKSNHALAQAFGPESVYACVDPCFDALREKVGDTPMVRVVLEAIKNDLPQCERVAQPYLVAAILAASIDALTMDGYNYTVSAAFAAFKEYARVSHDLISAG